MCGICGLINFSELSIEESIIRRMMSLQKHRGPDDEGVFMEKNVGLGFVRLSIIDLTPAGHQPMFSADKRFVIVFNGEIFNYLELRDQLKKSGYSFQTNTDTEVLLAAFQHWGEDCLNHFNGMWAFVIYDRQEEKIFAARDRFGIKPFYYYLTENFFAFASEIPPLLQLIPGKPVPDMQSIFDYLVFNRTDQTENTFFKEIKKLQHGHCINMSFKEIAQSPKAKPILYIKKWYDLRKSVKGAEGFLTGEEFLEMFKSSIELRLRSDVPVGVCLSGGLDSSSIVSLLLRDFKKENLNTFSAVYKKGQFGDESDFIYEYKKKLKNMHFITPGAQSLQNDLITFTRSHAEPTPSTSPYAHFKVMELAQKHVVVTLDGQGADELMAGYHYFFGFYFKDLLLNLRFGRLASEILHYLKIHQSLYAIKTFAFLLMPSAMKSDLRIYEKSWLSKDFLHEFRGKSNISKGLYSSRSLNDALFDHFEYKLEHLLKWEDRNSMHFSLEARVPFLDYRLVEKTLATDPGKIINKGITKHLLRDSMNGILPEKIRTRSDKMGFATPQDEWFRTPAWEEKITEILGSKSFTQRNLVDTAKAKKIFQNHLKREKDNYGKEIWKWVQLEIWFREFID